MLACLVATAAAQDQTGAPAAEVPATQAPAADTAADAAPVRPWTVVCPGEDDEAAPREAAGVEGKGGVCVMTQQLSAKPGGPRLLQVYLRRLSAEEASAAAPQNGEAPVARLRIDLPFGLDLAAGVELRIDGEAWTKTPIRTCLTIGCIAVVLLAEDELMRLKRGGRMGILVKAADGRAIAWPVSLTGFTAAHAQLETASQ
jgi:invasion protein IalB